MHFEIQQIRAFNEEVEKQSRNIQAIFEQHVAKEIFCHRMAINTGKKCEFKQAADPQCLSRRSGVGCEGGCRQ
jgi:hypothetical protein